MNRMIYCYQNINTGEIDVGPKEDFHEIRMHSSTNFKVLDYKLCSSKKQGIMFEAKCKAKYNF